MTIMVNMIQLITNVLSLAWARLGQNVPAGFGNSLVDSVAHEGIRSPQRSGAVPARVPPCTDRCRAWSRGSKVREMIEGLHLESRRRRGIAIGAASNPLLPKPAEPEPNK